MTRSKTPELESLVHGRPLTKAAFLDLLADPNANDQLARVATLLELLQSPAIEPMAFDSQSPVMAIMWEELARYADGSLVDSIRTLAVEEFLRREAPEFVRAIEDTPTVMNLSDETTTRVEERGESSPTNGGEVDVSEA